MTSFDLQSGMVQGPKSLTAGGKNVYKQSSTNFCNSQTLAAESFRQNK
jgi:hypothetical protein